MQAGRRPRGPVATLAIGAIRAYRLLVGSWLPGVCRFEPSCSRYAEQAIEEHGSIRGAWLTVRRVIRCQPFHPGGSDPVPPRLCAESESNRGQ